MAPVPTAILVHQTYFTKQGPTLNTRLHIERGIELVEQGIGDVLLFTAGIEDYALEDEHGREIPDPHTPRAAGGAHRMADYAMAKGFPLGHILTSQFGKDTVGETWAARHLAEMHGIPRIIGVANEFHAPRCRTYHEYLLAPTMPVGVFTVKMFQDTDPTERAKLDAQEKRKLETFLHATKKFGVIPGDVPSIERYLYGGGHGLYTDLPLDQRLVMK